MTRALRALVGGRGRGSSDPSANFAELEAGVVPAAPGPAWNSTRPQSYGAPSGRPPLLPGLYIPSANPHGRGHRARDTGVDASIPSAITHGRGHRAPDIGIDEPYPSSSSHGRGHRALGIGVDAAFPSASSHGRGHRALDIGVDVAFPSASSHGRGHRALDVGVDAPVPAANAHGRGHRALDIGGDASPASTATLWSSTAQSSRTESSRWRSTASSSGASSSVAGSSADSFGFVFGAQQMPSQGFTDSQYTDSPYMFATEGLPPRRRGRIMTAIKMLQIRLWQCVDQMYFEDEDGIRPPPVRYPFLFKVLAVIVISFSVSWLSNYVMNVLPAIKAQVASECKYNYNQLGHNAKMLFLYFAWFAIGRIALFIPCISARVVAAESLSHGRCHASCIHLMLRDGSLYIFAIGSLLFCFHLAQSGECEASAPRVFRTLRLYAVYSAVVASLCLALTYWHNKLLRDAAEEYCEYYESEEHSDQEDALHRLETQKFDDTLFGDEDSKPYPAECAICLGTWEPDDVIKITPCKHAFHSECLMRWLSTARTCALCRLDLTKPPRPQAGEVAAGPAFPRVGRNSDDAPRYGTARSVVPVVLDSRRPAPDLLATVVGDHGLRDVPSSRRGRPLPDLFADLNVGSRSRVAPQAGEQQQSAASRPARAVSS